MSTAHWSRIAALPEYKTWSPEEKTAMFNQWEEDFTGEVMSIDSAPEVLSGLRADILNQKFRLTNPDAKPDDQEAWKKFVTDYTTGEVGRLTKAGDTWKKLLDDEETPAALTEDGTLVVNPRLRGDAYKAAVLQSDAPARAKADALVNEPVWDRRTKETLVEDLTTILGDRLNKGTATEADSWARLQFTKNEFVHDGQPVTALRGVYDPRSRYGEAMIPGLKEFGDKAQALGVNPDEVLEAWKTRHLWGSAEDGGNLLRRDTVSGGVLINHTPKDVSGDEAPQLLWRQDLLDKEMGRLKLSDEEKQIVNEGLDEYRTQFAEATYDAYMATSFDKTGLVNTLNKPIREAAELSGLKADFKAYALANEGKSKREIVEGFMQKQEDRGAFLKFTNAWANSMFAAQAKAESSLARAGTFVIDLVETPLVKAAKAAGVPIDAMPFSQAANEIYSPIDARVQQAEGVSSVPFASDIGSEAIQLVATGGLAGGARVAARGAARGLSRAVVQDIDGFAAKALSAASKDVRSMRTFLREDVSRVGALLESEIAAGAADAAAPAQRLSAGLARLSKGVEDQLTRAIAQVPATATVYGTAAARSASGTWSDAFVEYRKQGMSDDDAAMAALGPASISAVITPAVMKLVPGGVERAFGVGAKKLGEVTLGQVFKQIGEKGIRQAFKTGAAKQLARALGSVVFEAGSEALEEGLDETGQVLTALATYKPDMTLREAGLRIGKAAALGGLMGGFATAARGMADAGPRTQGPASIPTSSTAPPPLSTPPVGGPASPEPVSPKEQDQVDLEATVKEAEAGGGAGPEIAPPAPEAPAPAPAPAEVPKVATSGRARMAEKILTSSGVDPESASVIAASLAPEIDPDGGLNPEEFRARVVQSFKDKGGLSSADEQVYSENAADYYEVDQYGRTPEQQAEVGKQLNAERAQARLVTNRGLAASIINQSSPTPAATPEPIAPSTASVEPVAPSTASATPEPIAPSTASVEPVAPSTASVEPVAPSTASVTPATTSAEPVAAPPVSATQPAPEQVTYSGRQMVTAEGRGVKVLSDPPAAAPVAAPTPATPPAVTAAQKLAKSVASNAPATAQVIDEAAAAAAAAARSAPPAPEAKKEGTPQAGAQTQRGGAAAGFDKKVVARVPGKLVAKFFGDNDVVNIRQIGPDTYEAWQDGDEGPPGEYSANEMPSESLAAIATALGQAASAAPESKPPTTPTNEQGQGQGNQAEVLTPGAEPVTPPAPSAPAPAPAPTASAPAPAPAAPKVTKSKKGRARDAERAEAAKLREEGKAAIVERYLREGDYPRDAEAMRLNFKAVEGKKKIGLTPADASAVFKAVRQAFADRGIDPDVVRKQGSPYPDLEARVSRKKAEAAVQPVTATRLTEKKAERVRSRQEKLNTLPLVFDPKEEAEFADVLTKVLPAAARQRMAAGLAETETDADAAAGLVAERMMEDRMKRAFHRAAMAQPEPSRLAWVETNLNAAGLVEPGKSTQATAHEVLEEWGKSKGNKTTAQVYLTSALASMHKAKGTRSGLGMGEVSSNTKLDEEGDLELGDTIADATAYTDRAPISDTDERYIRDLARRLDHPNVNGTDADALAKWVYRQYLDENGKPKPAFRSLLESTPKEEAMAMFRPVLTYGTPDHLRTRHTLDTLPIDDQIREMINDLGLSEDPASVVSALERVAANPRRYGKTNSENARDLLRNRADILANLDKVVFGGEHTYYSRSSKTIVIGTKARNSWGTTNGLMEEVTHLVQALKPLEGKERAELRKQLESARAQMESFVAWIEAAAERQGIPVEAVRELIADLYYSLGYEVRYDGKGDIKLVVDNLVADEEKALREFQARTLTDPFTKLVLGKNKDFSRGMFAWHAKRRFGMVPDPNSAKGKIVKQMIQADGDEGEIIEEKSDSLPPVLATRTSGEYSVDISPIPNEPGRSYVYLRDGAGDVMAMRQVDNEDAADTASQLYRDKDRIIGEVFDAMLKGNPYALGTRTSNELPYDHEKQLVERYLPESLRAGAAEPGSPEGGAGDVARGVSRAAGSSWTAGQPRSKAELRAFTEEVILEEERQLREWADRSGGWAPEPTELLDAAGAEHDVWYGSTPGMVTKRFRGPNRLVNSGTWTEYFDRLAQHRALFPSTAYTFKGFLSGDGSRMRLFNSNLQALVEQPRIRIDREATRTEITEYMRDKFMASRIPGSDDFYLPQINGFVRDLHPGNVVFDTSNNVHVLDPIIVPRYANQNEQEQWVTPEAQLVRLNQPTPRDVTLGTRTSNEITPPISMFRSRQHLADMRGVFKALTPGKDGTVPWQNLSAKITKGFKKSEADMVLAAIEPFVTSGRIKVEDAVEAMDALARASVQVVRLGATPLQLPKTDLEQQRADLIQRRSAIDHELDSLPYTIAADTGEMVYLDPRGQELLNESGQLDDAIAGLEHRIYVAHEAEIDPRWDSRPESATGYFTTVNPKPLDQMPDARDITVEEPHGTTPPYQGYATAAEKLEVGIKYEEGTHFPTRKNVIGFARMYDEKVGDTNGTFVFEVQSDWARHAQKAKDALADRANLDPGTAAVVGPAPARMVEAASNATPLLQIHETLSLKAAIADAKAKGQTWVAITDAETAMMTEGHDKGVKVAYSYKAPPSSMAKLIDYRNENLMRLDTDTVFTLEVLADRGVMNTAKKPLPADIVARFGLTERVTSARPTQEPGMRAAYDPKIGRLHAIMKKLTGDRGTKVNFGVHQNAAKAQQNAGFDTEAEARAFAATLPANANPRVDENPINDGQGNWMVNWTTYPGSPVFNGKADITAVAYDITKVKDEELSALFTRTSNEQVARIRNNPAYARWRARVGVWAQTDVNDFDYTDPATGDYTMGALINPDWRALYSNALESLAPGLRDMGRALLDNPQFDDVMRNRFLYIEHAGEKLFEYEGFQASGFMSSRRGTVEDPAFRRRAVATAASVMDTITDTARSPVFMALPPDSPYFNKVLIHEITHALMHEVIDSRPDVEAKLEGMLKRARKALHQTAPEADGRWKTYGLTNVHEFVSEAFSNAEFATVLSMTPASKRSLKSIYNAVMELIGRVLGIDVSLLDEVFVAAHQAFDRYAAAADYNVEEGNFADRMTDFAAAQATNLGPIRSVKMSYGAASTLDPRLKPRPLHIRPYTHVTADPLTGAITGGGHTLVVNDFGLMALPGEAERLIVQEDTYAAFKNMIPANSLRGLSDTLRGHADLLPILTEAAIDEEAARDLYEKMDSTAVDTVLRHLFQVNATHGLVDLLDQNPAEDVDIWFTRNSTETVHKIPYSNMAFVKDADGVVVDYTDSPDPDLPSEVPTTADLIEHARLEAGYNPGRLHTRAVRETNARIPVFSDSVWDTDRMRSVPVFGRMRAAEMDRRKGWAESGWFRFGKLPSKVAQQNRLREQAVASAEAVGKHFSKQARKFIDSQPDEQAAIELVNDALGSTRNWNDENVLKQLEQQRKQANKLARNQFLSAYAQVRTLLSQNAIMQANALHAQLVNQLKADMDANMAAMNAAIQADADARLLDAKAKQAQARQDLARLDPGFSAELLRFREEIDRLGREIHDDPTTSDDLKAVIDREKGLWLHRSYRLHRDPKWFNHIQTRHPKLAPVIAEAERFIREDLIERGTQRRLYDNSKARAQDPNLPRLSEADARLQAEADVDAHPGMVQAEMNEILDYGRNEMENFGGPSYAATTKPAILRRRKDIPEPIRALLGETKDPRINGAQSLVAAAQRVSNKRFLHELVREGLYDPSAPDRPYFLIPASMKGRIPGTENWEPVIAKEENNEASPLAGLLGPPAAKEALREVFSPRTQGTVLRMASNLTGYAMSTKTTLSPKSWARNFVSNVFLVTANGNITPEKWAHAKTALFTVAADLRNSGDPATREFINDLIRRGVIHDNQVVGLLRELQDTLALDLDMETMATTIAGKVKRGWSAVNNRAADFYQAQDDFWKIVSYLGEEQELKKIYAAEIAAAANDPAKTAEVEEMIRREAADTVVKTMPTYSQVPELMRRFRRSPLGVFFAPYVSWPAEIIRVSYNIPRLAMKDIASDNRTRQARGWKRLTWFMTAQALPAMIAKLLTLAAQAVLAFGDDDDDKEEKSWLRARAEGILNRPSPDEEREFRKLLPPWSQNASLLFFGKDKDGNQVYQDISFTDPFDYWKRLLRSAQLAATEDNTSATDAAVNMLTDTVAEAFKPFTGTQLLAGSVAEALTGKAAGHSKSAPKVRTDKLGDEFRDFAVGLVTGTNERDSGKIVNGLLHIIENSLVPGAIQSVQNAAKGAAGTIEGSKVYSLGDEALNTFMGIKISKLNPMESAMFRLRDLNNLYQDAASVRDRTLMDAGTAGGADTENAYLETRDRQKKILADTRRSVIGLRILNYKDAEIITSLKTAGFTNDLVAQVMTNTFVPTFPTTSTIERSATSKGAKGQNRIGKVIELHGNNPATEPLLDD